MLAPAENISVRFLKLILPERGYYIAAVKRPGGKGGFKPSIFAASIEELWSAIEEHDRNGWETYHACASFKEALSDPPGATQKRLGRTQANALGAKAFWIDLDAGKDDKGKAKHYATHDEAAAALRRFRKATGLPIPLLVSSGYGWHVYWPLAEILDPTTWKRYAEGLKALCEKHGLHIDPARTADISSVLRTPGTHNHKRGAVAPVSCNPEFLQVQQEPLETFATLLDAGPQGAAPMTGLAAPQPGRARAGGAAKAMSVSAAPIWLVNRVLRASSADLLEGLDDYPPAYAADIVNRCAQIAALREAPGAVSEPLWHAALGVLAHCEDGEALAHEWSAPEWHPAVDEKLERLKSFGPTTCEKFSSLNPTVCAACVYRGARKSPITLGARQSAAVPGAGVAAPGAVKDWERTASGALKPKSYINAAIAIDRLGVVCRYDRFHCRKLIEGSGLDNYGSELSDAHARALRDFIIADYRIDPGIENVREAAERLCEENQFDPILDYLEALRWDGVPRVDRWMTTYMSAPDTALNRAGGRAFLIAMVRRARQPGCKFDLIPVLEGVEGTGKSSALQILAGGADNFSDQTILGKDDKMQQELTKGRWLCEISDLAGMSKADIESTKAFVTRQVDKARPAYGRFVVSQERRCVFAATTNSNDYLRSQTGNRRFLPVETGRVDVEALKHDRDQLMAEAAVLEARGDRIELPPHLWGAAGAVQEARRETDPWEDLLARAKPEFQIQAASGGWEERSSSRYLLMGVLTLDAGKANTPAGKRLATCMRKLGWSGPEKMWINGEEVRGYARAVEAPLATALPLRVGNN
jgi:Virulence-associated protein E